MSAPNETPVVYGAEKPPTVEQRQAQRMDELVEAEWRLGDARDEIDAAHAELDRLGVPRGRIWNHDAIEGLVVRIRFMVSGETAREAQPRLLQSWAPDVWSGRRRFEQHMWEPGA